MPNYRFHCKNKKCGGSFHRHFPLKEFEEMQYSNTGWSCFKCGTIKMAVMKSNKMVKDGFVAGFQRNIGKVCNSYGAYKRMLKEMNLIEIGYDEIKEDPASEDFTDYWTNDILKEVYEEDGINLDGQLVNALQSGEIKL